MYCKCNFILIIYRKGRFKYISKHIVRVSTLNRWWHKRVNLLKNGWSNINTILGSDTLSYVTTVLTYCDTYQTRHMSIFVFFVKSMSVSIFVPPCQDLDKSQDSPKLERCQNLHFQQSAIWATSVFSKI